ncbi:MAG: ABC transporter permease subunit [Acidobacteria bacterium]|nr:ABC transporter permease subunit [Acidobacteriota bacterium]
MSAWRSNAPQRLAYAVAAVSLVPLVVSLLVSLTPSSYLELPRGGLTLRWYEEFWSGPIWREALWHSLLVGALATVFSIACGLAAAVALTRGRRRWTAAWEWALLLPLVLPGVALAAGLLAVVRQTPLWGHPVSLALAHSVLAVPVAYVALRAGLERVDPNLELAARGLGANPWQAFRHATLPQLTPALLAAALFCLAISLNEVTLTLFLATRDTETLPRIIWPHLRFAVTPLAAAASGTLLLFTLPAALAAGWALRPRRHRPS